MRRLIFSSGIAASVIVLGLLLGGDQPHAQAPPKQAVFETSVGTFILDLLPEAAPATVAFFVKTAESGGYSGTVSKLSGHCKVRCMECSMSM